MRIFLSYRREDASGHAGRLYDALAEKFGDENVFIDIDTIRPGVDFGEAITRAVASCDAVIALIGREWLTATDAEGRRRLDVTDDFVRLELEAALERDVALIPAFVQGSDPPRADQLPESLAPLARRQGAELRDVGWRDDVKRLIARLEHERAPTPERSGQWWRRPILLGVLAAALLGAATAGVLLTRGSPDDDGNGGDGGKATGPFPNAAERMLLDTIPPVTRESCERYELAPVARASVGCSGAGLFVAYHLFPREADLEAWYVQRRELQKIAPGSGSCTQRNFRGEIQEGEGGRRICYVDSGGEPYLEWMDPRVAVGATANMWEGEGAPAVGSLLRQWRCCLVLEPVD
jgi:hypothetical protein